MTRVIEQTFRTGHLKLRLSKSTYGTYKIELYERDGSTFTKRATVEEDTSKARITAVYEYLTRTLSYDKAHVLRAIAALAGQEGK